MTDIDAEIIVSDDPSYRALGTDSWLVTIAATGDSLSYVGPFVVDRRHPMATGLALDGAVWGAGAEPPSGDPIVTAGNTVLLSATRSDRGRREVHVNLDATTSTVHHSPNWPVLFWNLLDWKLSESPGLSPRNVRLGTEVVLRLGESDGEARVIDPRGEERVFSGQERHIAISADRSGLYRVETEQANYEFGSNVLSREESSLAGAATGRWGRWLDDPTLRSHFVDLTWLFLILALAVLTLHMAVAHRSVRARTVRSI